MKNLEIEKLLLFEKHFLLPNHDFERDAAYTLIEKIEHTERDDTSTIKFCAINATCNRSYIVRRFY